MSVQTFLTNPLNIIYFFLSFFVLQFVLRSIGKELEGTPCYLGKPKICLFELVLEYAVTFSNLEELNF